MALRPLDTTPLRGVVSWGERVGREKKMRKRIPAKAGMAAEAQAAIVALRSGATLGLSLR